jgi:hypothetical protein
MIIVASKRFNALLHSDQLKKFYQSFENLITSHSNGHHIFLPDQQLLDFLIAEKGNSSVDSGE